MEQIMSHSKIIEGLKSVDAELSRLKGLMPELINQANELAVAYRTGLLLSRHIVGGRIYLRWRFRAELDENRKYIDLSEGDGSLYLTQFSKSVRQSLIEVDLRCQALNHAYTVTFATRTSLRRLHKHSQGLKALRNGHSVAVN